MVNLDHLVVAGNSGDTIYLKFLEGSTIQLPHCQYNTSALDTGTGFKLSHYLDRNRSAAKGAKGEEPKAAPAPHPDERPLSPAPVDTVVTPQPAPQPLEQPKE